MRGVTVLCARTHDGRDASVTARADIKLVSRAGLQSHHLLHFTLECFASFHLLGSSVLPDFSLLPSSHGRPAALKGQGGHSGHGAV